MDTITAISALFQTIGLKDVSMIDLVCAVSLLRSWADARRKPGALPGTALLYKTSSPPATPDASYLQTIAELRRADRFCKLAMAPYGSMWKLVSKLRGADGTTMSARIAAAERQAMSEIACVEPTCLIYASPTVEVSKPIFCVFVTDEAITLAIRGTHTLSDVLTDVRADDCDFSYGTKAHSGIAAAAKNTYEAAKPILEKCLAEHPKLPIVITGHSLGGGTALLVTILLYEEREKWTGETVHPFADVNVECIAFAPPPVVRPLEGLPAALQRNCTSWIHRHDIVPRLSIAGMKELVRITQKINRLYPEARRKIMGKVDITEILNTEPAWVRALLLDSTADSATWDPEEEEMYASHLCLPGKLRVIQQATPIVKLPTLTARIRGAQDAASRALEAGKEMVAQKVDDLIANVNKRFGVSLPDLGTFLPKQAKAYNTLSVEGYVSDSSVSVGVGMGVGGGGAGAFLEDPGPPLDDVENDDVIVSTPSLATGDTATTQTLGEDADAADGHRPLVTDAPHSSLRVISVHELSVKDHLSETYLAVFADLMAYLDTLEGKHTPDADVVVG